jgi:hypothetical protein
MGALQSSEYYRLFLVRSHRFQAHGPRSRKGGGRAPSKVINYCGLDNILSV